MYAFVVAAIVLLAYGAGYILGWKHGRKARVSAPRPLGGAGTTEPGSTHTPSPIDRDAGPLQS